MRFLLSFKDIGDMLKYITLTNVVTFSPILLVLLGCLFLPTAHKYDTSNFVFVPFFGKAIKISSVNSVYYFICAFWWLISLELSTKAHASKKSAIYVAIIIILLFIIYGLIALIISKDFLLSSCFLVGSGILTLVGSIYVEREYYNKE